MTQLHHHEGSPLDRVRNVQELITLCLKEPALGPAQPEEDKTWPELRTCPRPRAWQFSAPEWTSLCLTHLNDIGAPEDGQQVPWGRLLPPAMVLGCLPQHRFSEGISQVEDHVDVLAQGIEVQEGRHKVEEVL